MSSIEDAVFEMKMSSERASFEKPSSKRTSARSNFFSPAYPTISSALRRGTVSRPSGRDVEGLRKELKRPERKLFSLSFFPLQGYSVSLVLDFSRHPPVFRKD